ncbi:hypothetical protein SLS53_004445 [Cytospora paraplurivora]|uniref:Gfd2/YDR514C-like C-terminal domain-containing protein n=1 Tax=Cytospora paraplurivora TaxID=2898453 RepID=A0AAN9U827_9PEZI
MRLVNDNAQEVYDARALENEPEYLWSLWKLSDHERICFISIDLEGPPEVITELGFVFQRKNDSRPSGRHIIVKGTQHLKKDPPKPCGFGITSEEIGESDQLYTILDDFFTHQLRVNQSVILTGFDIKGDLSRIDRDCSWRPPRGVSIIDAAIVFRALSGMSKYPSKAAALATLGVQEVPTAPFHNAANDAWYALEILFREAEQAVRQKEDPDGEGTIDWLAPTNAPPSSPILSSTKNLALRLSYPYFLPTPICTLHPPPRPRPTSQAPAPPPSDQQSQPMQPPSSTVGTPGAPQPGTKRRRRREKRKMRPEDNVDTTDATLWTTRVDSRLAKTSKLKGRREKGGMDADDTVDTTGATPSTTLVDCRPADQSELDGRGVKRSLGADDTVDTTGAMPSTNPMDSRPSKKTKLERRGEKRSMCPDDTADAIAATPSTTPVDNRPAKKPRLEGRRQSNEFHERPLALRPLALAVQPDKGAGETG